MARPHVLLTFTGFHDPYSLGLVGQEEQPGPILSLVRERSFDRIIFFATPLILDRVNASLRRPKQLSIAALTRLQSHSWPGNVRDLENVIERSARLARQDIIDADDLLIAEPVSQVDPLATLPTPAEGFSMDEYLTSVRKQLILRALESARGNQSEAARLLGMTPQAVHKFLRKHESGFNRC